MNAYCDRTIPCFIISFDTHLPRHLVQQVVDAGLRETGHQLVNDLLDEVVADAGTALLRQLKRRSQVDQVRRARRRASTRIIVLSLHLKNYYDLIKI